MSTATVGDRYATRVPGPLPPAGRADPVVYPGIPGPLPAPDVDHYARHGYLVVDRLVGPAAAARLLAEVERLGRDRALARDERVVREPGGDAVRSIFEVHLLSPLLGRLVTDHRLVDVARQILGSEVYVHQSRVNRKPAFHGEGFAWHSDFETWHAEDGMPSPRAVSISVALTANYVHNGSLMLVSGSHRTFVPTAAETPEDHFRQSLRRQVVGVPDGHALSPLVDRAGGIAVVTGEPGSAVVFDSNTMHGSTENITPYPRTNVFVVYNSVENTLVDPFAAARPRPGFIAARRFDPVRPTAAAWDA